MSWLDDFRAMLGRAQAPLRSGAEAVVQNAMQPAVNTAMDVASTPASITRGVGLTMGQLARGDENASDTARRTFAGIFNPEQRISGEEINANSPIGGGSGAANFITDIATDPMAMAGILHAGSSGARMTGGLLRGGPPSAAMRAPMAAASGAAIDLAPQAAAATEAGPVGSMLQARRNFTVLNDVGLGPNNLPNYRAVGGLRGGIPRAMEVNDAAINAIQDMQSAANAGAQMPGSFQPGPRVASIANFADENPGNAIARFLRSESGIPERGAISPQLTRRHEVGHGIINQAMASGDASSLPTQWGVAANMQASNSPAMRALGLLHEEAAMHGVGEGRGFLNNLRGQVRFLSRPEEFYMNQASRQSPLAARIYGSQIIPRAGLAGAGALLAEQADRLGGQR